MAHGSCPVVVRFVLELVVITYIPKGYFTDTGETIVQLPPCQWSKPEEYG